MTAGLAAVVSLMQLTGCQTTDYMYAGRRSVPWGPRAAEVDIEFEDVCALVVAVVFKALVDLAESQAR